MLPNEPGGATAVVAAAEGLPFGVAITDPHGNITWANAAYAQLSNCTPDELLGQSAGEFPWDALSVATPLAEPWLGEAVCRRASGEAYTAKHTVTTLRNLTGESTGFCVTREDNTRTGRDGGTLGQAEANLSALIESTDDLIWSVDPDCRLLTFNRALRNNIESTFGFVVAVGIRPEEWLPAERAVIWRSMYSRALSEGPYRAEHSLFDGRTLELSFNPIRKDGQAVGISVFGKDITERKRMQDALKTSEEKFAIAFRSGPAMTAIFRPDEKGNWIIDVNEAFERSTGYQREEVVGHTSQDLEFWADPGELEGAMSTLRAHGSVRNLKYHFRTKTGDIRTGLLSTASIELDGRSCAISTTIDITEQEKAEQAIQQANEATVKAERHYRRLFNSVSDAVIVCKLEHDGLSSRVSDGNEKACNFLGYTREELLHLRVMDIDAPENSPDAPGVARRLFTEGHLIKEQSVVAKDGRRLPVEINTHVFDLDGTPTMISCMRDLSQRKEAESKYRDVFEGAIEGIYQASSQGQVLNVNPALAAMLGYDSPHELMSAIAGTEHQLWIDPIEREQVLELLKQHRLVRGYECHWKCKDGTACWISFNARIVFGTDGQPLSTEGFVEDITERKRTQTTLQQANEATAKAGRQYRQLFNSISDAVFVYELRENGLPLPTRYLEVNDNACRLLGYTREELLQLRMTDIIPPGERSEGPANALKLLADGQVTWSGQIATKSGQRIPVDANTHIFDLDGRSLAISSVRDITDRKESEERYQGIFAGALEGIYRTSPGGTLLAANPALAKMGTSGTPLKVAAPV
jgi:PAS domain S-box-containing protein